VLPIDTEKGAGNDSSVRSGVRGKGRRAEGALARGRNDSTNLGKSRPIKRHAWLEGGANRTKGSGDRRKGNRGDNRVRAGGEKKKKGGELDVGDSIGKSEERYGGKRREEPFTIREEEKGNRQEGG